MKREKCCCLMGVVVLCKLKFESKERAKKGFLKGIASFDVAPCSLFLGLPGTLLLNIMKTGERGKLKVKREEKLQCSC